MKKDIFKNRIRKTYYPDLIEELNKAWDEGDDALKRLLLGTKTPKEYTKKGKYQLGKHEENDCSGVTGDGYREDQLCKCLYFFDNSRRDLEKCEACASPRRYTFVGRYHIKDYQVPAYYYVSRVGKIDLVLTDGKDLYATEVKPPKKPGSKGNPETLLRMVAEIITYTLGTDTYQKAIAFFENTPQAREYENLSPDLQKLLEKLEIKVFCFRKREGDTYEICKL